MNSAEHIASPWLKVPEAAAYCRISPRAFLDWHLPANDSNPSALVAQLDRAVPS